MSDTKACIQCGVKYEATETFFHKSKDGLHARCKRCRNKHEQKTRKKKTNRRMAEIEKGAVDLFIASARIGGANIPHTSELLECAMKYFGGVEGFMSAFMKQFYDSPAGGAFRTKQLDSLFRLIQSNTAMGGAKKPLELMTEEELEAQYRRDLMEAAMKMTVNGSPVKLEKKNEVRDMPVVGEGQHGVGEMQAIPAGQPDVQDAQGRVLRGVDGATS
jgi:hypothetical protein